MYIYDSASKESACNVGDLGSIPGLGRSPGEGKGCPFQDCGLENSMDCIVHGVAKSRTQLSDFHFHFHFHFHIYILYKRERERKRKESCSNSNHVLFSSTFSV